MSENEYKKENIRVKRILDLIAAKICPAFAVCGCGETYVGVILSNRLDLCEYQCNGAIAAAKVYKKKPVDIANDAVEKLAGDPMFLETTAAMPGFINIKLDSGYLVDHMNGMRASGKLGLEEVEQPAATTVDYGEANVAKPSHAGHLRPAIIGEAIKRMDKFLGYHVTGDVHLRDWGLQMGQIIEELRDRQPELVYLDESYTGEYPAKPPLTIGEPEKIYPVGSAKSKTDEVLRKRAQEATLKLQNGYVSYCTIWNHIMEVSVTDLRKNHDSPNAYFDLWKGESDAQPYIPGLIEDLEERGLAYESQGALVVDIAEETDSKELPSCITRKSDGAALYAISDLGTIIEREREYQPFKYIYITDKRQELHFIQVFCVVKKAGYVKPEAETLHLISGTMNGKDDKPFKTRDGGAMRLEDMVADTDEAVFGRIMENRSISKEEARETVKIVGLTALKYGDLSNQVSKNYVFDMERFTSFEGNTGPYILYTIVRIKSILSRFKEQERRDALAASIPSAISDGEKALMLELTKYNEAPETSLAETAPHKICQCIYDLSNASNRLYHDNKIIAEENKAWQDSWTLLITLTKDVFCTCIDLLGIEVPEWM